MTHVNRNRHIRINAVCSGFTASAAYFLLYCRNGVHINVNIQIFDIFHNTHYSRNACSVVKRFTAELLFAESAYRLCKSYTVTDCHNFFNFFGTQACINRQFF